MVHLLLESKESKYYIKICVELSDISDIEKRIH